MDKFLSDDEYKKIGKALDSTLCYNGLLVGKGDIKLDCDDKNVDTFIKASNLDDALLSFVVSKLFEEGKIVINGDEKDINYIKKLLGENNE